MGQRRWLIIRNGAIGDTVLLSSLIQTIRSHEPESKIHVVGIKERVELLVGKGMADKAFSFEEMGMSGLYYSERPWDEKTKRFLEFYDGILAFLAGEGSEFEQKLQVRMGQIVRVRPPMPGGNQRIHITEHYRYILKDIFPLEENPIPRIALSDEEKNIAQRWKEEKRLDDDSFRLGLHVGAGSEKKRASLSIFHALVDYMRERFSVELILPQGPADYETVRAFVERIPHAYVIEEMNLRMLAAILQDCDLFVGNDSGITHIAAAVGTPTVALFRQSDPEVWAPRGEHTRVYRIEY